MRQGEQGSTLSEGLATAGQGVELVERAIERRKAVRVSCRIPVVVTSQRGQSSMEVRDLSHLGAQLSGATTFLQTGEMVYFRIAVPSDPDCQTHRDVHCFGRIAWSNSRQHGVEFVAMRRSDEMLLCEFVQGMIPWWRLLLH